MKKISALFAVSLVLCVGVAVQTTASAEVPRGVSPVATAVNPGVVLTPFAFTGVKGSIKVPAAQAGTLNSFNCADLTVVATSKEMVPPPPGGLFQSPQWTRSGVASGNYASGTCSYSFSVPASQAFGLTVGAPRHQFPCDTIGVMSSPAWSGYLTVAKGQTKDQNFSVSSLLCEIIK